jgi:hypothetical protein
MELPLPAEPIVGAAQVHAVLTGWRRLLQAQSPRADASLTAPVSE